MKKINETIKKINEQKMKIAAIFYAALMPIAIASCADAKWNSVIDFILPWISRMGGAVILVGGVMFGLAFKNDDPDSKTKGIRTVIAGCIILAVGLSSGTFLY